MKTSNQTQKIQGIARYVNWHEENIYCEVPPGEKNSFFTGHLLTFQVELLDNTGSTVGWIPVELRLWQIKNICLDGDEVEVEGEMGEDKILLANYVHNLKTKAMVTTDNNNFISSGPDRTFWRGGIAQKVRWVTDNQLTFNLVQTNKNGDIKLEDVTEIVDNKTFLLPLLHFSSHQDKIMLFLFHQIY